MIPFSNSASLSQRTWVKLVHSVPVRPAHRLSELAPNPLPALMDADQVVICFSWRCTSELRRAGPAIRKRSRGKGPVFFFYFTAGGWGWWGRWGGCPCDPGWQRLSWFQNKAAASLFFQAADLRSFCLFQQRTKPTSILRGVTQCNCCSGDSAWLLSEVLTIPSNSVRRSLVHRRDEIFLQQRKGSKR